MASKRSDILSGRQRPLLPDHHDGEREERTHDHSKSCCCCRCRYIINNRAIGRTLWLGVGTMLLAAGYSLIEHYKLNSINADDDDGKFDDQHTTFPAFFAGERLRWLVVQ